jgi:hypothetical protein
MAEEYRFSPRHDRMPGPTKKWRVPSGGCRGDFRQGEAEFRVGLYARVSTHDQSR